MKAENTDFFPCFVADTSFMAAYLLNGFCDDEMTGCIKDIGQGALLVKLYQDLKKLKD